MIYPIPQVSLLLGVPVVRSNREYLSYVTSFFDLPEMKELCEKNQCFLTFVPVENGAVQLQLLLPTNFSPQSPSMDSFIERLENVVTADEMISFLGVTRQVSFMQINIPSFLYGNHLEWLAALHFHTMTTGEFSVYNPQHRPPYTTPYPVVIDKGILQTIRQEGISTFYEIMQEELDYTDEIVDYEILGQEIAQVVVNVCSVLLLVAQLPLHGMTSMKKIMLHVNRSFPLLKEMRIRK